MGRKIKFRVWDIASECYLPVTRSSDDGVLGITINGTGIIYMEDGEVNVQLAGDSGVIIEQYTGLKDKNGKEIYEGDIIKVIGYGLYEVFWRKWDSSFILRPIDASVVVENKVLMLCEDWEEDYEVIGNIHENPELLKKK